MKNRNIENVVNSLIFNLEKTLFINPEAEQIIEAYLELLLLFIRKYALYDKVDIYLSFVLQINKYSKQKLKRIVRWILSKVIIDIDDAFLRSRIYYAIAKSFLRMGQYGKAQNFAIKALKIFYSVIDERNSIHFLHYFQLILLISKLAFYRNKYYVSHSLLQHLFSKILNYNLENIFERNFIYSLLESSLWLIISYLFINKNEVNYANVKEIVNYFTEIIKTFRNYIDIDVIKDLIFSVLLKNLKRMLWVYKRAKKIKKYYRELFELANNLYQNISKIPNFSKIIFSLFKDYIIGFIIYYPDNYKLANKFIMKAIYLNYHYIRSNNLVAISKFLLFKIMKLQKIYNDLVEYMKNVDIYEYIMNNDEISEEVIKDIMNKRMVYIN